MTQTQLTLEEAKRYRQRVAERLSEWYRLTAIVAIVAALIAVLVACSHRLSAGVVAAIAFAPPFVTMIAIEIRSGMRPKVTCPNCGDNWEYDLFLKNSGCEVCGLRLPREARDESLSNTDFGRTE